VRMKFNSPIDIALFIIEIIGCISFATSGAFKAIRKKADIVGVIILTLIEVFGGGLIRDLIIGQGAPHIFWDPEYLILSAVTVVISAIWYVVAYIKKSAWFVEKHRHDFWIYALDAAGVAVFVVCGCRVADASLAASTVISPSNTFGIYSYVIALGVISGVGGGMFRDVFVNEIPMIFRKYFYIIPCVLGSAVFTVMYRLLEERLMFLSVATGLLIIIGLRMLAIIFKWNLPPAKGYIETVQENNEPKK